MVLPTSPNASTKTTNRWRPMPARFGHYHPDQRAQPAGPAHHRDLLRRHGDLPDRRRKEDHRDRRKRATALTTTIAIVPYTADSAARFHRAIKPMPTTVLGTANSVTSSRIDRDGSARDQARPPVPDCQADRCGERRRGGAEDETVRDRPARAGCRPVGSRGAHRFTGQRTYRKAKGQDDRRGSRREPPPSANDARAAARRFHVRTDTTAVRHGPVARRPWRRRRVSITSGSASAVARPKSNSAAKAVKTSVVYTRTRSNPGTANSESQHEHEQNDAATSGHISGNVMDRSTRIGLAAMSPASSRPAPIARAAASVASITIGKNPAPSTSAAATNEVRPADVDPSEREYCTAAPRSGAASSILRTRTARRGTRANANPSGMPMRAATIAAPTPNCSVLSNSCRCRASNTIAVYASSDSPQDAGATGRACTRPAARTARRTRRVRWRGTWYARDPEPPVFATAPESAAAAACILDARRRLAVVQEHWLDRVERRQVSGGRHAWM